MSTTLRLRSGLKKQKNGTMKTKKQIQREITGFGLFFEPRMGSFVRVKRTRRKAPYVEIKKEEVFPNAETPDNDLRKQGWKVLKNETYSRRSRYRANHYYYTVYVPYGYDFRMVWGHVPTFIPEKYNRNKPQRCYWLTKKGIYGAKCEEGYIYKERHLKAESEEAAMKIIVAERRRNAAGLLLKRRYTDSLKSTFIGLQHLKRAGACDPGIKEGARKLGINLKKVGGIRADVLYEHYPEQAYRALVHK